MSLISILFSFAKPGNTITKALDGLYFQQHRAAAFFRQRKILWNIHLALTQRLVILLAANGISAAIDDGLLNIPFRVKGFETVFFDNLGNAVPEVSAGGGFTERQTNMMRGLSRGKRFFITKIRAQGPDGIERTLNGAVEVIVN